MKQSKRAKPSAAELIREYFATDELIAIHGTDDPIEILAGVDLERIHDLDRFFIGFDEEAAEFEDLVRLAKKEKQRLDKKREAGSLEFLAEKLGKTSRQVREYCKQGLVPGAYLTPGRQWRVRYENDTLTLLRAKLGDSIRQRTDNWFIKRLRKQREERENTPPSFPEELVFPLSVVMRLKSTRQYACLAATKKLVEQNKLLEKEKKKAKKITVSAVARITGFSRTTVLKYFEHIRSFAKSVNYGGSVMLDQANEEISHRKNGKVITENIDEDSIPDD